MPHRKLRWSRSLRRHRARAAAPSSTAPSPALHRAGRRPPPRRPPVRRLPPRRAPVSSAPPRATSPRRPPLFAAPPPVLRRPALCRSSPPLIALPLTSSIPSPSSPSPSMKGPSGPSPSRKGKTSRVKAGSRRSRLHTPMSWMSRTRRSNMGAKLAPYSGSDGSPERPVKVVEGGPSSASVPKMGAGGGRPTEPGKLEAFGGGSSKEAIKLVAGGSGGSPEHVINIGRSRRRIDNHGQLYVLDTEDEGSDMEPGLCAPDSQDEAGGSYGGHRRSAACARLAAARLAGYKRGRATIADPAPEVAMAVDILVGEVAPEVAMVGDVPVGEAAAPGELRPELKGLLIVFVIRVRQLLLVKLDVNSICVHAKIVYDFVEGYLVLLVEHLNQMHGLHYHLVQKEACQ